MSVDPLADGPLPAHAGTQVPAAVQGFRQSYRASEIPRGYQPALHLLFTFGGGAFALLACLWQRQQVRPLEWLTVPLTFLYVNLIEYLGHRYPMHHPFPGLRLIYRRHAGQHHRFFTHECMPFEQPRDLRAVLFPPLLVMFFFGGAGVPTWFALRWILSANVAWLFIATGIGYFLNYEVLHAAYHARPDSILARNRLIARLQWLHRLHHDPRQMAHINFNISYPICDWLFGTLRRD